MNFPLFISKRIHASGNGSFATTISRLAIASIAIGLGAMIMAYFVLGGFQDTIKNKIYDLKGHVEITKFNMGSSYNEQPIVANNILLEQLNNYPFTDHIQFFAHKAGLFKTEEEVEGVLFKGVSSNFKVDGFQSNMIEGRFVDFSDSIYSKEVVISSHIAKKLRLELGEKVIIYFVQNPPRYRNLEVVGIYETGLEEIDKTFVFGDIGLLQRINNWPDSLVGGMELFVKDEQMIELADRTLFEHMDAELYVEKVSDKYIQIFDWLNLIDQNVSLFLWLILIVACFNMISILLILIMERTNMIGLFQALGSSRQQIQKVFLYNGMWLIVKGMLLGNILALFLAFMQHRFHIIPLDSDNYYMHFVPIRWDWAALIFVNFLTLIVVSLTLMLPLTVVSRIKPINALKFD